MRKRKLTCYLLSFLIGSASVISCRDGKDALSRDKMVEVLHDIQLAEAIYQNKYNDFRDKEQKDALIQGILNKHGITQAELDSSLVWYADNAEIYMKVNDSVISSLKTEVEHLSKTFSRGLGASNVNNSILPSFYYLSGYVPTLTFDIDSVRIHNYPNFSLEFNTLGIQEQMKAELEVVFEYRDTTITKYQSLNKDAQFKVLGDTLLLKNISGYIHIDARNSIDKKVLLYNIVLKNIETPKDSTTVNKVDSLAIK